MSTVFDLDDTESKRLDELARANPIDLTQHDPSFWSGSGTAAGTGFLSGAAKTANVGLRAIDAYRQGFNQFTGADKIKPTGIPGLDAVLKPYQYDQLPNIGRSSVDYWAPDAATTGTAGKVLHGLAELPVPAVLGGVGGIGIVQGSNTQQELQAQGVDATTATTVGATEGLVNIAGLKVGAFGGNLLTRLATSTVGNVALNTAGTAAERSQLNTAGYKEQGKQYNPFDPTSRAVDVLAGLFGGAAHHWAASRPGPGPQMDPQVRDATLTAKTAENFNDASAPGVASTVQAQTEHSSAMESAVTQVNDTGQVNVDGMVDPAAYIPRGDGMKDGVAVDYPAFRRQLESGGNPTAANPLSSALGADQFTEGTWLNMVKQEKPAWADGLSREQVLAQRTNPQHSGDMAAALDRNSTAAIESAGLEATPDNLYASHHFGESKGIEFAKAADDTPVSDILTPAQIRANPYLAGKTKGEVVANWYERAGVERDETSVVSGAPKFDTGAAIDAVLADIPVPRTGAEAGALIDRRLSSLDELASGALDETTARANGAEAGELEDLIRSEYGKRQSGVKLSPANSLTDAELSQAEGRLSELRTAQERHRQAMAAGKQAADLRSRLAGADDATLIAESEKIHPVTVARRIASARGEVQAPRTDATVTSDFAAQLSDHPKATADYAALPDSEGGTVLNTDVARELSPDYNADRTRSAAVHEPASSFIKRLYAEKLADPTPAGKDPVVRFTAGGTGAGKTTGVRNLAGAGSPEITYDTNMNTLDPAISKIDQALSSGRKVQVMYTFRDPVEALTHGALPRAERQIANFGSGRTVPLSEHAKTHTGSREVIEKIAEKYKDNPNVEVIAYDNSRGRGNGAFVDLADLPKLDHTTLEAQLREAILNERQAGRISEPTYRGFAGEDSGLGSGDGGQPQAQRAGQPAEGRGSASSGGSGTQDGRGVGGNATTGNPGGRSSAQGTSQPVTPLDVATRYAFQNPTAKALVGFDADGNPTYVSMSDAVAAIEADRQRAVTDTEAYTAAAACALTRGLA